MHSNEYLEQVNEETLHEDPTDGVPELTEDYPFSPGRTHMNPYVEDCIDEILFANVDEYGDIEAKYGRDIYDRAMDNLLISDQIKGKE